VVQDTPRRVRDQIHLLRRSRQLPFGDLLDPAAVSEALAAEKVAFRECIFTPLVTLWAFLSQVLSPDHSCREAVDRLIAYLVARGQPPCQPETDTSCKARKRLPIGVIRRLVRRTAADLDDRAPEPWLWKGRRALLVDGSTVSMPDTPDNQRA
jgi:hypothetical protein